jgi:fatty-acid peroxygenase
VTDVRHAFRLSSGVKRTAAATAALALGALGYLFVRTRRPSPFPRDPQLDSTSAFLSEGYTFISKRCERLQSDVFEARLMLQNVFCMRGEDASRMFFVPGRFTRRRAIPVTTLKLLQDFGSVQQLDGEAHRYRKRLFISLLMTPARVRELVDIVASEWRGRMEGWAAREAIVLHDEAREILCRGACAWAGVPLPRQDVVRRAREFGARRLRRDTERWIGQVIEDIRAGRLLMASTRPAHTIAWHRDTAGKLLSRRTAAVELINVLRWTVAVARFITFAALALHEHPDSARELGGGDEQRLDWFVQEVRRFYPFFPAIGGRVATEFDWRGYRFAKGTGVLLDVYGTNHDPRIWGDPQVFRPRRFENWDGSAFSLIPQGGGSHADNHRCPGEDITIALVKDAVRHLTRIRYDVPRQDLRVDLTSIPALPASGLVIANVEPR